MRPSPIRAHIFREGGVPTYGDTLRIDRQAPRLMDVREAYTTLGLDPRNAATLQAIRSSYRKLILRSHPDTVQGEYLKSVAHEKTVHLNHAYDTLKTLGFPLLSSTGSAAPTKETAASAHWEPQPDPGDVEFDQWRSAFLRDFRSVFLRDLRQVGVVRASAVWMVHLVWASAGIMLGTFASPKMNRGQQRYDRS